MTTPYRPSSRYLTTPAYQPAATYKPGETPYSNYSRLAPAPPRLVVELFPDRGFRGVKGTVIANTPYLGEIGFIGITSAAKVFKGPGYANGPSYKAILHELRDYKGRQLVLEPGYYSNLHDIAYDFGDRVSSISFGPALVTAGPDFGTIPLIVEVYRDAFFRGRKCTVLRDISDTAQLSLAEAISSLRVFRGPNFPPYGCKAIFYENPLYEGQSLEVELGPLEYHKEIPDLHNIPRYFGDIISSIKIESWVSGGAGRFTEIVFLDEFDTIKPEWQWVDPKNDSKRQLGQPAAAGVLREKEGWLELHVGTNHDLWWGTGGSGGNMDAPRMLQPISGDFGLEVKMTSSEGRKEHGGILVWEDANRFLRLDKTSSLHAFRGDIRFETHIWRRYSDVGRGSQNSPINFLRLERIGNEFQAYCSTDGQDWQSCGTASVVMKDPVMVGIHALCPGNTPPTITRFDYFKIMRPPAMTTLGLSSSMFQR